MENDDLTQPSAIQRACAHFGWGGQSKLARELSKLGSRCTPQAVQKMCATGHVPEDRVLAIERITGISRHELRPDLYPIAGDPDAAPHADREPVSADAKAA